VKETPPCWVSLIRTHILYPNRGSPRKTSRVHLNSVAVDPQDQVWFVDDGPNARILQFNPKSKEFNSYPIPE